MKYESDILKRLIKTYGVVGNPKYMSEIIKQFIVQGKECFPHLFTYQADWLAHIDEFGLNPTYTVSYTGQSIYAPNTLEKPVKSAILSGSTKYRDIDTGEFLETFEENRNLELVSVKMPVLMTYTNLFTGFAAFGYIDHMGNVVELQGNILSDFIEIHEKTIAFRTFRENGEPSTRHGEFAFYDNNKNFIGRKINSDTTDEYTTVPDGTKYVRIWSVPLDGLGLNTKGMMIYTKDKPSVEMTKYLESYKTNILTVNEDVTLRSNGNICDELNLLTGQLTQRIDEDGEVLSQEVIKTVDLNILDQNGQNLKQLMSFNGGTHFNTKSTGGSLLPTLTVDVVTNLEETLNICSTDGNTL